MQKVYAVMTVLFIAALLPLPYEFYISLRVLICLGLAVFIYVVSQNATNTPKRFKYVLLGLVVLYNPLFVVHLGSKLAWALVNLGTLYFLYMVRNRVEKNSFEQE